LFYQKMQQLWELYNKSRSKQFNFKHAYNK
jgi:hypothetical protein